MFSSVFLSLLDHSVKSVTDIWAVSEKDKVIFNMYNDIFKIQVTLQIIYIDI